MTSNYKYDLYSAQQCSVCLITSANKNKEEDTKIGSKKLLTCSRCHLVKYCSVEHQRLDWSLHRQLCRAAQQIMQHFNIKHPFHIINKRENRNDLHQLILQIKLLFKAFLKRPLQFYEENALSYPSVCAVCYKIPCNLYCNICKAAFYCCAQHKDKYAVEHAKICQQLKIYYCPYKVLDMKEPIIEQFYTPSKNFQYNNLKQAFEQITLIPISIDPTIDEKSYSIFSKASDFSCISTICYAQSKFDMNRCEGESYTVIIVGATYEGDIWFNDIHTKFFFLHYSNVRILNLYFIGPELLSKDTQRISTYNFQNVERVVKISNYKMFYEDFVRKYKIISNMIISYNCGFSEFKMIDNNGKDTWSPAIVTILKQFKIPIIFTSYTYAESLEDYDALLQQIKMKKLTISIKHICWSHLNPYHDLRPIRNINICDVEQIYYRNGYIQMLYTLLDN